MVSLDLLAAGLDCKSRRGSEKRTQATADLEDILIAFEKLDEDESIPEIYCEATDLAKLPPVVADACTELVQRNGSSLEDVKGKLDSLVLSYLVFLLSLTAWNLLVLLCILHLRIRLLIALLLQVLTRVLLPVLLTNLPLRGVRISWSLVLRSPNLCPIL